MMEFYLGDYTVEKYAEIGLWLWNDDVCMDWKYDSENFLLRLGDEDAVAFRLRFGL